ncbi:uncharacterized protein EAF02_003365 [Botrytis sinoallii]|uniref:uncharacterized protein n=1 Tax=Botrytis sinoallii TaxID=1463999 RepID=UPI0018FF9599|nr:uncharacterized protein EAF02_003365 [Botrytis sinoallii]KAF7886718.1 hypothetical protein EAF02_003365 [Botrytis sinoallii]
MSYNNRVAHTYDELRDLYWSRDQIISGEAGPVRGRIPEEYEPSLASGEHYSYPSSHLSQPLASGSHYSSGNYGQNSNAGQYGPTFDNLNIAQPQPQTAQYFQQYSPPPPSINSSDLNPSIINPQEVQDYGSLAAAHNYAQRQQGARNFVEDQRQLSPPTRGPSSIYAQTPGSPATFEQLQTEIPGAKYIPLKPDEPPYGVWSTVPWDSGYFPGFKKTHPNKGVVADLWIDTWQGEEGCEDERICLMFDHVDLYRLAYITTVHLGAVHRPDTIVEGMQGTGPGGSDQVNTLGDIVAILNKAGRPPGFGGVTHRRPNAFTEEQVRRLFGIMANKNNINRGKAFRSVEKWALSSLWSPRLVLRNVPETIVNHWKHTYDSALRDKGLRWDWRIKEFIYVETVDSKGDAQWTLESNAYEPGSQPSGSTSKEQQPGPAKYLRRDTQGKHSRDSTSSSSHRHRHSKYSKRDEEHKDKGKKAPKYYFEDEGA